MKTKTVFRGDKALVDQKVLILALPHEQVNAKGQRREVRGFAAVGENRLRCCNMRGAPMCGDNTRSLLLVRL
jgi:hypothetical protein